MSTQTDASLSLGSAEPTDLDDLLNRLGPDARRAVTEASTWVTWKQGKQWTRAHQEGLDKWLGESEINRFTSRYVTQSRERNIAAVRRGARVTITAPQKEIRPLLPLRAVAYFAAAGLAAIAIGAAVYLRDPGLSTRVGEHRTVKLEDGTEVTLNTATRIKVKYSAQQRLITLTSGEAYFVVSKRPDWPFVVAAGDREVMALGTAFVVRHDDARVAVTLLEGQVAVTELAQSLRQRAAPTSSPALMSVGERLTFEGTVHTPKRDHPSIGRLTAWRRGVVNIDDMNLAQAVSEMNRYSKFKIIVEEPAASVHVGGVFRYTDIRAFARALALTYGLSLTERDEALTLSGAPGTATDLGIDANKKRANIH